MPMGSVVEWIYARCAGIVPESPGFRRAALRPVPDGRPGHVEVEYCSAAGTWRIAWKVLDKNELELGVTVPFGCEGLLTLPYVGDDTPLGRTNPMLAGVRDGVCHLRPGSYRITCRMNHQSTCSTRKSLRELMGIPNVRAFLTRVIPMVSQVPDVMLDMSRELAAKMGSGRFGDEAMEQMDQALAQI